MSVENIVLSLDATGLKIQSSNTLDITCKK